MLLSKFILPATTRKYLQTTARAKIDTENKYEDAGSILCRESRKTCPQFWSFFGFVRLHYPKFKKMRAQMTPKDPRAQNGHPKPPFQIFHIMLTSKHKLTLPTPCALPVQVALVGWQAARLEG
jgi:hypothetical protein